jgi:hypothetical protein
MVGGASSPQSTNVRPAGFCPPLMAVSASGARTERVGGCRGSRPETRSQEAPAGVPTSTRPGLLPYPPSAVRSRGGGLSPRRIPALAGVGKGQNVQPESPGASPGTDLGSGAVS